MYVHTYLIRVAQLPWALGVHLPTEFINPRVPPAGVRLPAGQPQNRINHE